ncbi:MAG: hypothetical protein HQL51_14230 [Magnetococcales bacterium]|nr:hypothetical protein [Magnetococcales bacterium]
MNPWESFSTTRRRLLRRGAGWGLAAALGAPGRLWAFGAPVPVQGFREIQGRVTVNGRPAQEGVVLQSGDRVETAEEATAVFVSGRDATRLRPKTVVEVSLRGGGAVEAVVEGLQVLQGGVLAVFGIHPATVKTPVATMGIRGTGIYIETSEAESYLCTCYGRVELAALEDPRVAETLITSHHDTPRTLRRTAQGSHIVPAPMIHHNDAELRQLEQLVFRTPPTQWEGY